MVCLGLSSTRPAADRKNDFCGIISPRGDQLGGGPSGKRVLRAGSLFPLPVCSLEFSHHARHLARLPSTRRGPRRAAFREVCLLLRSRQPLSVFNCGSPASRPVVPGFPARGRARRTGIGSVPRAAAAAHPAARCHGCRDPGPAHHGSRFYLWQKEPGCGCPNAGLPV